MRRIASSRLVCLQERLSTETALLEVLNSVYIAADENRVTIPGLDISAAFDTSATRPALCPRTPVNFWPKF